MSLYLMSQIFVIISTVLLGATYFFKDKLKILILCLVYCIFYGTHYILLGALTGGLMTLISFIRNLLFFKNSKNNQKNSPIILIILIIISLLSCIITYKDIFSIISLFASVISTYSIWQDNTKLYKFLAVPVSICFLVYAIYLNSIVAIITESVLLIMEFVAILKLFIDSKLKVDII